MEVRDRSVFSGLNMSGDSLLENLNQTITLDQPIDISGSEEHI